MGARESTVDNHESATSQTRPWQRWALGGIILLALFLHFFRLEQEGYANLYYAAAVKSMLSSWHNFFFVSFDPGGFVSVDKPPLGLWIQTASAALFGFDGLSLLLPQAIAGVLSVILIYHLVRRSFGTTAGLLAALTLAVTPISVAANRNNTMDSLLVLTLLLGAWAVIRATETGRLRWLLLSMVLVGLGFNIKMLQAFLVLPAFCLLYLLGTSIPWWKRFVHLGLATIVLLAVSLAWVVAVDLTPPEERPYVGSSQDNTVLELIVGHNGLSRLLPGGLRALTGGGDDAQPRPPGIAQQPPSGQFPPNQPGMPPRNQPPQNYGAGRSMPQLPPSNVKPNQGAFPRQPGSSVPFQPGAQPPAGAGPMANNPQGPAQRQSFSNETGTPGILRLFNQQLAGQISWLIPLAAIGLLAAAWQSRPRFPLSRRHQALLLWTAWLLPMAAFFSVANLFHRYYLEMMSPAIAALVGAGAVALWNDYRSGGWKGWVLPLAIGATAIGEAMILIDFESWSAWLTPVVLGGSLLAVAALVAAKSRHKMGPVVAATLMVLLIPLLVWSWIPVWYGGSAGLPFAGPDLLSESVPGTAPRDTTSSTDGLIDHLEANRDGETFIVAASNANQVAPVILETGEPAMAWGGFTGSDDILSTDDLAAMVAAGDVRFFLTTPDGRGQGELASWIVEHCQAVPTAMWQSDASGRMGVMAPGGQQLNDCAQ